MSMAFHPGWSITNAFQAWSSRREDPLRRAADWAMSVVDCAGTPGQGGRILISGTEDAFRPHAIAIAREMAAVGPQEGEPAAFNPEPASGEAAAPEPPGRVILIDASLGAPVLPGLLKLPRAPGLAELCQYRARFEDVIRRDGRGPVHFLASGRPLSSERPWGETGVASRVFRALDASYRYVLFSASFDEALKLAETMARPFSAVIMLAPENTSSAPPAGFPGCFGCPVRVIRV